MIVPRGAQGRDVHGLHVGEANHDPTSFPFFAFFLQDEGLTWRLWVWVKTQGSTDFFFFSWYWINEDQNQSKSAKVCQVSLEVRLFDIELLLISVSPVHVIVAALTVPVLTVEILCLTMVFFLHYIFYIECLQQMEGFSR